MVPLLVLTVALVAGGGLLLRWYVQADPKQLARFTRWLALGLGALFILFVVLAGRWAWLPAAVFAAIPWLYRLRAISTIAKNMRGPTPGQSSAVETPFLRMSLSHDSGEMEGEVLSGAYRGRRLSNLSLGELIDLLHECAGDDQSRAVLESYLDRTQDAAWREQAAAQGAGAAHRGNAQMLPEEAYEILGVASGASDDEIEHAYRRLMLKMHPDQGGSDYLAAKINQAKEVLLGR